MSDAMHHVIFELVADPQRQLYLYSSAGGLRDVRLTSRWARPYQRRCLQRCRRHRGGQERDFGLREWRSHRPAHRAQRSNDLRAAVPGRGRRPLQRTCERKLADGSAHQVSATSNTTPPTSAAPSPAPASAPAPAPATSPVVLAATSPPTMAATASPVAPQCRRGNVDRLLCNLHVYVAALRRVGRLCCDRRSRCARYTLTSDDAGAYIRVRITATSATSSATAIRPP